MNLPDEFCVIFAKLNAWLNGDSPKLVDIVHRSSYDKPSLIDRAQHWLHEQDPELASRMMAAFTTALACSRSGHPSGYNRMEEMADFFGCSTLEEIRAHEWHHDATVKDVEPPERHRLNIAKLASRFGCCEKTIRRIADEGYILLHSLPGRQRGQFAWSDELQTEKIVARLDRK
jgi:AraC-like DNA-binding protein